MPPSPRPALPRSDLPRQGALPLLLALVLGLVVLGPALANPLSWLAGDATVDSHGSWWFQWWVAHALVAGASPFQADVLFHPWGKDILTHTGGNLLDAAAILPVRLAFGPAAAWNALVCGAVVTNALAAGVWARRLGGGLAAVLLAEVLVGLHPFVLNELAHGRPTQAILAPLLLALAYGDDAMRTGSARAAAASAALLALSGWIYWYAASFGALALCVLAIGRPFGPRLRALVGIGLGSLLLCAPLVVPLALAMANGDVPGLLPLDRWLAGVQDYTNAQGGSVQVSTLSPTGIAGLHSARGWAPEGVALGLVGALAVLGAPRRWLAVALLGAAIAVGPFPLGLRNPVYLGLVAALPPYERLYWPVRAVSLLAAVGVVGIATALARIPEGRRALVASVVGVALVGEVLARGALPLGRWRPEVPEDVRCVGVDGGAGLVLPYGVDQLPLVWQTVLEAPMLNGMAERSASLVPAEQKALRADNGWVRAVLTVPADPRAEVAWTEAEKEAVRALGYRWVVLRPDAMVEDGGRISATSRARAARRALIPLLGAPVLEREDMSVYAPWGGMDTCRALGTSPTGASVGLP
ncbi:MAG: hypothetical protein Q8P41_11585 [Pseudomonadota bacterium]|nr:hypothetical protein [Pseudomonadota bacterium]